MNARGIAVNLLVICFLGVPISRAAEAAPADIAKLHAAVARLLNADDEATAEQHGQFESLRRLAPRDDRLDYVQALLLIRHHDYRTALAPLARYVAAHPDVVHTACTHIWLLAQEHHDADAIKAARALGDQFPRDPGPPQVTYYEAAEFLGTLFGYLEAVRPNASEARARLEQKNRLINRLGTTYTPPFDAGREQVVQELTALEDERRARQDKSTVKVQKQQETLRSGIARDQNNIAKEREKIQTGTEQLQDAGRELRVVQQQLAVLQNDRARLTTQIISAQAYMAVTEQSFISGWGYSTGGSVTPTAVIPYNVPASTVTAGILQAQSWAKTLASLTQLASQTDLRIRTLQARAAALSAQGTQRAELLSATEEAMQSAEHRAQSLEKQLHRAQAARSPDLKNPVGKMLLFSTYSPFPHSQERQRVLAWFDE